MVECICKGADKTCEHCGGYGQFKLAECPRTFIGQELTEAINVAGLCTDGNLPVNGGLLDQSAYFLDLLQTLRSEQRTIEQDQMERDIG